MGDYFYVQDGILMGKIFSTIGAAIFFCAVGAKSLSAALDPTNYRQTLISQVSVISNKLAIKNHNLRKLSSGFKNYKILLIFVSIRTFFYYARTLDNTIWKKGKF
jgi:hypothetical protein